MNKVENPQGKEIIIADERAWVEAQWAGNMQEAIERVRELHENHDGKCLECSVFVDDGVIYPCRTIKALDGE